MVDPVVVEADPVDVAPVDDDPVVVSGDDEGMQSASDEY